MTVAIVGAGMAGLTCAERLVEAGHRVVLFDKSRGVGGRMATRRIETDSGTRHFDHGCQYFTASSTGFRGQVEAWAQSGLVARWPEVGDAAWVAVPGMNALARSIASRHDTVLHCHVRMLNRQDGRWLVMSDGRIDGPFDAAVIAVPPEQAAPILSLHDFAMARVAASSKSKPCWSLMLALAAPLDAPASIRGSGTVGWAARNSSKPGRGGGECWVIQASPDWSVANLERPPEDVEHELLNAFATQVGAVPQVLASNIHRWRFAHCAGLDRQALWNPDLKLGACGDWLVGHRVECAFISGAALAHAICSTRGTQSGDERATATG